MSEASLDVIVVGGGVFGVSAALELRRRGHGVILFDAGRIPREEASSTDISKAIRMDYGADEFYTSLVERALEGWDAWNRDWPRPLYHQSGVLFLSLGPMQPGGFEHDSHEVLTRRGHPLERISRTMMEERFPVWNADRYPDGYFDARAGWAESAEVVRQLAEQARAAGVELREEVGVHRFVEGGSGVNGVLTTDEIVEMADYVVVAAGPWTPKLIPGLEEMMWPVGQPVLHFRPEDPASFRPPVFSTWCADVSNTGWYGFPATGDGIVKVANHGPGRAMEPDGSRVVDAGHEERFREFLAESLPSLADAPLAGGRICLYCDTWDGDFYIDHHPDRTGLFVATGGSGHGFKFAPVLGGLIADRLEGKPDPHHDRFRWRKPGERSTEAARHL